MKKGVLLGWILILLVTVLFSVLTIQKEVVSSERGQIAERQEIRDLKRTYTSVDRSLRVIIDSSIRRAVISSTNHIFNTSNYLDDAEEDLKELMINGTLNGSSVETMGNNTLTKWVSDLEDFYFVSKDYNVSIKLKNTSLSLNDSFHIQFKTTIHANISKEDVAFLSKEWNVSERTSIVNFEDIFYLENISKGGNSKIIDRPDYTNFTELLLTGVGDNGWCYRNLTTNIDASNKSDKILLKNNISGREDTTNNFCGVIFRIGNEILINTTYLRNSSDVEHLLSNYTGTKILFSGEKEKAWNVSNFIDFVKNGYYHSSSTGPSFFDRLEGNNYCSYCGSEDVGIESFVNKNLLLGLGISVDEDASNIDYLYANQTTGYEIGINENTVSSEFYSFRIDDTTFDNYFE